MIINITKKSYAHKPQPSDIRKMTFNKVELKANELCSYINEGYAFTNIFNNKGELTIREKKIQNFKEAWIICFDIDHNETPMEDFTETLTIKPTICYTTPSNGKDGYCFRILYVLDEPITTNDEYKDIYEGFAKYLDIFDVIDAKAKDSSRYFNGSKGCDIVCNQENTIRLNDVRTIVKDINQCENESTNNKTEYIEGRAVLVDDSFSHQPIDRDFINDFNSLSYRDFYEKCYLSGKYVSQEHTFVEDDGTKPIIELSDDFIEIIRKFKIVDFRGKKIPVRYKFKDGEGRRDKLWNNGMLRRKINPSLRFEDILYNLVSEVILYYDNSDGQLNRTTIFSIAKSVMKFDLDRYNPRIKKRRSYIASSAYCQIHGISKRKAVAMYQAKKRSKAPLIEYYYREGLKPKDVQALIKESGEEINIRTIQNWYEKNGIYDDKYEKIFQLIDTTKSKAENGKFIRSNGFSIDDKKLLNMIKEKKAMKKDVFESDEERMNFQLEMMRNKREREAASKEVTGSVPEAPESVCAVDPTTIRDEEKEELTEENNEVKMKLYQLFEETIDKDVEEVVETFDRTFDYSLLSDKELGMELTEIAFDNIGYNDYPRYTKICDNIETVFGMQKPKSINIKKDVKEDNMVRIGKYQVIKKEIYDMLEEPVDALPF